MRVMKRENYIRLLPASEVFFSESNLGIIVYSYTSAQGQACAIAFAGRADKPAFRYAFPNPERRAQYVQAWVEGRMKREAEKKARREEKKNKKGMGTQHGDTLYLSAVETAKLVRLALVRSFPGVKFSVKKDGTCLRVEWIDGPTASEVDAISQQYAGGRFDGSIDYAYNVTHWLLADGSAIVAKSEGTENQRSYHAPINNQQPEGAIKVSMGARFVFSQRKLSPELTTRLLRKVCGDFGLSPLMFSVCTSYDGKSGSISNDKYVPECGEYMATMIHRESTYLAA